MKYLIFYKSMSTLFISLLIFSFSKTLFFNFFFVMFSVVSVSNKLTSIFYLSSYIVSYLFLEDLIAWLISSLSYLSTMTSALILLSSSSKSLFLICSVARFILVFFNYKEIMNQKINTLRLSSLLRWWRLLSLDSKKSLV